MKQNNKTCICCGKKYTFCTNCGQFDNEPRWKAIYHNETCKDIFIIVSDYLQKEITKEEAKIRLLKCDLSYKKELNKILQKGIDEILYEETVENISEVKEEVKIDVDAEAAPLAKAEVKEVKPVQSNKMKYGNDRKRRRY